MILESTIRYLIAIYELGFYENPVSTKSIALTLEIREPSVTWKIQSLAEKSLVKYRPRKGVTLTTLGEQIAIQEIHRLEMLKTFLVHVLGYSIDDADKEARQLVMSVSERFTCQLAIFIEQYEPRILCDNYGENLRVPKIS